MSDFVHPLGAQFKNVTNGNGFELPHQQGIYLLVLRK